MPLQQNFNEDASGNLVISGTVTANAGTGTLAVSAASLPLPAGAATAAKQPALGTAGSASTDVITIQGITSMTALKVDGSAVTQPISAASLPLPSGASTAAKQPALGSPGTASTDVLTIQGHASMTPLQVTGATAGTATMTNVSGSASSVSILALNASRKGVTLFNDSTAICRVAYGATASATSFTVLLQPNSFYEMDTLYTGAISGIWASATGAMRVTELT